MAEDNTPVFQIQRMYLKDLSLEIPHAPQIFLEQAQPTVEVSIDAEPAQLADGIFEVTVTVTLTTRLDKDKVVFLVEARQAGIFELRNIPDEQMAVVLNEINFEVLYQQKLQAAQAEAQAPASRGNGNGKDSGLILPGRH